MYSLRAKFRHLEDTIQMLGSSKSGNYRKLQQRSPGRGHEEVDGQDVAVEETSDSGSDGNNDSFSDDSQLGPVKYQRHDEEDRMPGELAVTGQTKEDEINDMINAFKDIPPITMARRQSSATDNHHSDHHSDVTNEGSFNHPGYDSSNENEGAEEDPSITYDLVECDSHPEIKELLQHVSHHTQENIELQCVTNPLTEFSAAVRDVDQVKKIEKQDEKNSTLGLIVLDEPSAVQSSSTAISSELNAFPAALITW
ncbi:uncharacterized protein [Apostichopus japonicus]|uniref:uncharacterized protein n=1 Tax=Stichopus japonicus TaxID=307972 RepID=UPI003AB5257C